MLNQEEKKVLFQSLQGLAAVFETEKQPEVIKLYVEALSDNTLKENLAAIKWAMVNCKFFPKPVELIEQINPKGTREDADHLAGRAIKAITEFGSYRAREAKESMGSEAWEGVLMLGGWQTLCDSSPSDLGTLRAQLRAYCLVAINKKDIVARQERRIESTSAETKKIDFAELYTQSEKLT
jgi:hypothetical protein